MLKKKQKTKPKKKQKQKTKKKKRRPGNSEKLTRFRVLINKF
jgi:hypothetical protein